MKRILTGSSLLMLLALFACDRAPVAPKVVEQSNAELKSVQTLAAPKVDFQTSVASFLETYCLSCHGETRPRARISLEELANEDASRRSDKLWTLAMENVWSETMPPMGRPKPSREEIRSLDSWLDKNLIGETRSSTPGPSFRRLTRVEFNNTIRDLTGLDVSPADAFPSDDLGDGFDNNSAVLSLSPLLLERIVGASEQVVSALARDMRLWSKVLHPEPDRTPLFLRDFVGPVRSEPTKRVGVMVSKPPADPAFVESERAYQILRAFADKAYRRPARHEELTRLLALFESSTRGGERFERSIELPLQAILASPAFLFIGLPSAGSSPEFDPRALDSYKLAERLSYFLWSSLPDEELTALAAQGGTLFDAKVLAGQVERMLRSPRSLALSRNFSTQWLQLRGLASFQPDPLLFPSFDRDLRDAMLEETVLFFDAILREDRSILEFLDSDFIVVNDRLARHYGLEGVQGRGFRKIALVDQSLSRGGLLTQASVLTATSNPTNASPVKRGLWIMNNLIGAPPGPPPTGVEPLNSTSIFAADLRSRLEAHRSNPECASCHRRLDPLGFALSDFDAIGALKTSEEGRPIDSSAELPGFGKFKGSDELKKIIASRTNAFTRLIAKKMLTYAIGRSVGWGDQRAIDDVTEAVAAGGFKFSRLVKAIVLSDPFREVNPHEAKK